MARLVLQAIRGGQPGGVTILNGTTITGYSLLDAIGWGNYAADIVYSTRKDGVATATDYSLPPRSVAIPIRFIGASWAAANTLINTLGKEVEAIKRSGGKLTYQATPATIPIYLTVRGATLTGTDIVSNRYEIHYRSDGTLSLICDPAAVGDPMGFRDDFTIDTTANYTQDAGAFAISAGSLGYGSVGAKRFRHTAYNYAYTNVQITIKITTGSTVASADWAVMARCQGSADTALLARIQGSATNLVSVATVKAGTIATLASAAFTPAVTTSYWLRLRLEGARATAEVFTAEPKPLDVAAASATLPLTAADQQAFVSGACGVRVNVVATGERFDDFDVRPNTHRLTSPDVLHLTGIPGDLPALVTSEVTVPAALATQASFGGVFWAERQRKVNLVWNGNLEQTASGTTTGWFNTAVTGVIAAAAGSGPTRNATLGKYGSACVEFLTTAVANQGLNFPLPRRFNNGQTYVAIGWLQSAAGVGSADLLLGANGDLGTTAASALTAAFSFRSCVWTPTADRDIAYLCPRHVAATAETVRADGMGVFEATPQTQNGGITNVATAMPLTAVPPEGNPAFPCIYLLEPGTANQELVRATAADATGLILTIDRGWDGTTAVAHATGTAAYALPGYWFDANSDGVHGTMLDVIGLANPVGVGGVTRMTADASMRSGFAGVSSTTITTAIVSVLVDPSACIPPDFTNDELLVEVWLRYSCSANAPAPRFTTLTVGEDAVSASRYDLENGSGGLSVVAPTGATWRFVRVGVVPIRYADSTQRRRVQVWMQYDITSIGTAISFDYLMLVPAGQRATTPTGRANDANYPDFLPTISLQQTRRWTSDLVSEAGIARETMLFGNSNPQGGIICPTAVTFPAANADVMVKLSNLVPNNPAGAADGAEALSIATDATITATFNVQPRFLTLR
jgi:hypothetical protein